MPDTKTSIESAVFRRLITHLQDRNDVQNIDIMETAGFCRNCLSRWYKEESERIKINISEEESKELVYGMPYKVWKEKFQK
tara:strand:+ start:50 stop:292 length:243 start_codon:yes stop_codon:yes gene_type:complete